MRGRKRKRSLLTQKTNNCCLSSSSRRLDVALVLKDGSGKCWWGDEEMKWPLKKTVRQLDRWWHWRASQLKLLLLWWLLWLLKLKLLKLKTQLMRRRRRHLYLSKNQDLDLMVIKTHTHTFTLKDRTGQHRGNFLLCSHDALQEKEAASANVEQKSRLRRVSQSVFCFTAAAEVALLFTRVSWASPGAEVDAAAAAAKHWNHTKFSAGDTSQSNQWW